jgi:hypothetical protein
VPTRTCPRCYAVQRPRPVCEYCGSPFPLTPREVAQVEGELAEVKRQESIRDSRREVGRARTFDELVALAQRRSYQWPTAWARKILAVRQASGRA